MAATHRQMFANISSPICAVFRGRFTQREELEVVTFSLFTDKGGHGIEEEQGCTGALPQLFVGSRASLFPSQVTICPASYKRLAMFLAELTRQQLLKSRNLVNYSKVIVDCRQERIVWVLVIFGWGYHEMEISLQRTGRQLKIYKCLQQRNSAFDCDVFVILEYKYFIIEISMSKLVIFWNSLCRLHNFILSF